MAVSWTTIQLCSWRHNRNMVKEIRVFLQRFVANTRRIVAHETVNLHIVVFVYVTFAYDVNLHIVVFVYVAFMYDVHLRIVVFICDFCVRYKFTHCCFYVNFVYDVNLRIVVYT
jgi:hypothetical protein